MTLSGYWQQIEDDLDWRQSELASLKILVLTTNPQTKKALLRSLLAMLYAHYEGFCKNALIVYAKAICESGSAVNMHNESLILTSLKSAFKRVRGMPDREIFNFINGGFASVVSEAINIKYNEEFETSNLYPNVLEDLCAKMGIECPELNNRRILVKSLVGRRNDIAHGKDNDVKDLNEYNKYEEATIDVMYSLALSIEEAMRKQRFLKAAA
ncbi:MAE_28990/MAE_18760 family HEPN-like nuclease [Spirosoma sp. RP8]|uniref:MAE_28990/MAE_18760 family HEPN-like nuclease n=1 Tax=Spirosoma liriopis TaxID=2937440 RepID=A0ABT0HX11_9BACT|nr:MAE_28990/MAE_18760 family HEPN-like nuclease [Spirosoma liriopis]MCK8496070.1 MAE_28990/MAE_18760 family HEPN-like nuclease [Spirosoma liriopis]